MEVKEIYIPFRGYHTYCRIVGNGTGTPIVLLHGGPGSTHNYFEMLDVLAESGRQVIMYDQLGCGNSYIEGHPELWTEETWSDELQNVLDYLHLDKVHLLGQSWGGMLAISYLLNRSQVNIASVILSSTLSSASLWAHEQHRMIGFMSKEDQQAIAEAERSNCWNSPEYLAANDRYMKLHCSDIQPTDPDCLTRPKKSGTESYVTGWGPNEYTPTGTLHNFEYTDRLHEIHVPTLVISGTNDLSTPLVAKTMYDAIPNSKWELFDGARHMVFAEQNEKYCRILNEWMVNND